MDTQFRPRTTPTVSVILPVFNGEKYIGDAIESVLDQTFRDFELIIINDGSTDGTLTLLERYRRSDSRVVIVSRENKGLVETLNEGISLATGFWIARMDADDVAHPNRFERQLHWLQQTDADICGSWIKYFGTSDRRVLQHPESDEAIKAEMLFGSPFAHSTVMMKTELVSQLLYSKEWETCEDYDLWERAVHAGWRMTNVQQVLLSYRLHKAQVSSITSVRQRELSQKIRYRYWGFMCDSLHLKPVWIEKVLALRETAVCTTHMDMVDAAFDTLLTQFQGAARVAVFHHMTRLYLRAAGNCRDIVPRWSRLNDRFGTGFAATVKAELFFLSTFRVRPDTKFHAQLRKIYSNFGR